MVHLIKETRTKHLVESEQRGAIKNIGRAPAGLMYEITVAVKQSGIKSLHEKLITDLAPRVNEDGFHWMSGDEVKEWTQNKLAQDSVRGWLEGNGVEIMWTSKAGHYVKAKASISTLETLLKTEFYMWEDHRTHGDRVKLRGSKTIATMVMSKEYSLPEDMHEYVEAVFNTCQIPPRMNKKAVVLSERDFGSDSNPMTGGVGKIPEVITPTMLKATYEVTQSLEGYRDHAQSVFETGSEYFSTNDLKQFQLNYYLRPQAAVSVGDHSLSKPTTCSLDISNPHPDCFEGNLDIQYIMGISQNTTGVYWYVGGGNPFVEWLVDLNEEDTPPKANSVSWGTTEQEVSASVLEAFDREALVLAARGVTLVVASGDDGAMSTGYSSAGTCDSTTCATNSGSEYAQDWNGESWSGTGYFPSWPATSPYVTAVGATMGPDVGKTEVACQSNACYDSSSPVGGVITTGGGFSTHFPRPEWQDRAITSYLQSAPGLSAAPGFNPNGRAIPDVSLVGVKYEVVVDSRNQYLFGTSATAPVFAGFVSLINAQRASAGKASIGFLNYQLYQHGDNSSTWSKLFNDVSSGNNRCCKSNYCSQAICCSAGFESSVGWDPVTGWGSVRFPALAGVFNVSAPYVPSPNNDTQGIMNEKAAAMTRLEVYVLVSVVSFFFVVVPAIYCSLRLHRKWSEALTEEESTTSTTATTSASTSTFHDLGSRVPLPTPTVVAPSVVTDVTVLESTISPLPLPPNSTVSVTPNLENFPTSTVRQSPHTIDVDDIPSQTETDDERYACPTCGSGFTDPVALVDHSKDCQVEV